MQFSATIRPFEHLARLCIASILVCGMVGCGTPKNIVMATRVVSGDKVSADPSQVRIIEHGQPVSLPFEMLGQVTIFVPGHGLNKSKKLQEQCLAQMRKEAAGMGADAVIGYYTCSTKGNHIYDFGVIINAGTKHLGKYLPIAADAATGIAVKFLNDGQAPKHTRGNFIAAIIPMEVQDKNLERVAFMKEQVQRSARLELLSKGYYVLPDSGVSEGVGFLELTDEKNPMRDSVGGNQTEYLLGFQLLNRSGVQLILIQEEVTSLKAAFFSKTAGKIIASRQGSGLAAVTFVNSVFSPNTKLAWALHGSVCEAMKTIPDISTKRE